MAVRGPDGRGAWYSADGRVALGHRRLSIIDLSERGAQPMSAGAGRLHISFNGEIYNYQSLRQELEAKGFAFQSDSDTEVLLHLYADRGVEMFGCLRGMFAFMLWDEASGRLLLARDPYGIKPLYYADDGRTVRVASQVKALLAGGRISRQVEPAAMAGLLLFGSVPEPFTIREAIRALPAGSYCWVDANGAGTAQQFFSLAGIFREAVERPLPCKSGDLQEIVRAALLDSVCKHLIADVPVGAFLSAGVDSGSLVGLMRDAGQRDIQTLTLAFEEFRGQSRDESVLAERVARHYETRHTVRVVTEQEFQQDLPRILDAMDQPSIDGVNTWFVSKMAHELGLKVALSGLGGDELCGGYPSFRDIPRWVRAFSLPSRLPFLSTVWRRLCGVLRAFWPGLSPKVAGMIPLGGSYPGAYLLRRGLFMPWELSQLRQADELREGQKRLDILRTLETVLRPDPGQAFARVASLESSLYMRNQLLRDTDWASMAHSLEIRVPLVDSELLRRLASVFVAQPALDGKSLLAHSPSRPLPSEVVNRPKTGFETPVSAWLQALPSLQVWRQEPLLAGPGVHWSRRWAYTVMALSVGS